MNGLVVKFFKPGIGHQVGLELIEVDVEGSVEPQGGGDGGHDLADQPGEELGVQRGNNLSTKGTVMVIRIELPVQVGVGRPLNVQVPLADVIDGLIVNLGNQLAIRSPPKNFKTLP